MPKSTKLRVTRRRVGVKDLPAAKKKLTGQQMKKVRGGVVTGGLD